MKNSIKCIKNIIKNLFSEKIFSYLEKESRLLEDIVKKLETIKEEKKEGELLVSVPKYSTYVKLGKLGKDEEELGGVTIPPFLLGKSYYLIILNEKKLNHREDSELILAHELVGHVDLKKRTEEKLYPLLKQLWDKGEKIIKIAEKDERKYLLKELYYHFYYHEITFLGLQEAYAYLMQGLIGLFNSLKKGDKSLKIIAEKFMKLALNYYLPYEETSEEIIKEKIEEVIKMQFEKGREEAAQLIAYLSYIAGTVFLFKMDKEKGGYLNNFLINYIIKKSFSYNEIKELILKLWEYKEEIEKEVDIHLKDYITYLKKFNSLINKILE
jgi:hypothetical protein